MSKFISLEEVKKVINENPPEYGITIDEYQKSLIQKIEKIISFNLDEKVLRKNMNVVNIYTDGACSKNPGLGGWAAVFNYSESQEKYVGGEFETTNNRMELAAVLEVFKIIDSKAEEKEYLIHSDSSYVVDSINKSWIHSWNRNGWRTAKGSEVKNMDLWQEFLEIPAKTLAKVNIKHIRGHDGHMFNELVDSMAVAVRLELETVPKRERGSFTNEQYKEIFKKVAAKF